MENVSKALIIAGAILVAIAIIAVGMLVFRNAIRPIDEFDPDVMSMEMFNSQFTPYIGEQTGSDVQALIGKVRSNNEVKESDRKITITPDNEADIQKTARYNVRIDYNAGFVSIITCTKK